MSKRQMRTIATLVLAANLGISAMQSPSAQAQNAPVPPLQAQTMPSPPPLPGVPAVNPTQTARPSGSGAIAPQPSAEPFYQTVWQMDLWSWPLWRTVLVCLGAGAFGGLVYALMSDREMQAVWQREARRNGRRIHPLSRVGHGLAYLSIGAAIAPPAMLFLRPETAFASVAMSIVAGTVGSAIFSNMQERMLANLNAERANTDKIRAEHEATQQTVQRINVQQAIAVKSLIDVAVRHAGDGGDWLEVRRALETLAETYRESNLVSHPTANGHNGVRPPVPPPLPTPGLGDGGDGMISTGKSRRL